MDFILYSTLQKSILDDLSMKSPQRPHCMFPGMLTLWVP